MENESNRSEEKNLGEENSNDMNTDENKNQYQNTEEHTENSSPVSLTEEKTESPEITAEEATQAEEESNEASSEITKAEKEETDAVEENSEESKAAQPETEESAVVQSAEEEEAKTTPPPADESVATEAPSEEKAEEEVAPQQAESSEAENNDSSEEEDEEEEIDYTDYTKEQLVKEIKELSQSDNINMASKKVQAMLPVFEELHKQAKQQALQKYLEEGGEEDGFEYKNDELDNRFEANFKLIHDRKVQFNKDREKRKEENYEKKIAILEELRAFVDSDETNISFNKFKDLQLVWKEIGPVPAAHNKTLWANYNALVDRFYDNRSIYFELKELDRKKNLETKLELCVKAEKLKDVEILKDAIIELNELHEEFKHVGPVPKEEQENLWNRFKAASDAVYARRKEHFEHLKVSLEENLIKKQELGQKAQEYITFNSDRIKEWNNKTNEILDLQKQWEAIGGLPRAKAKETNKAFWGAFKTFFHNKSEFFKKLDAQRDENLAKKLELIKKAEELKENEDFNKTAGELKALQQAWKDIGPVPEKQREKSYQAFKAACDHFFKRKRESQGVSEQQFEDNLKLKETICEELEKLAGTEQATPDKLKEMEVQFHEIGFVPRRAIKKIKNRYQKAVEKFIGSIEGLSEEEKEGLQFEDEINRLKDAPNSGNKIYRREQQLRKEIQQLENDMSLWKNNLEFFAASKTADKLRDEFNEKIADAAEQIRQLKKQLRLLRSM